MIVVADAGLGLRGLARALRSAGPEHVIAIRRALLAVRAWRLSARPMSSPGAATSILLPKLEKTARLSLGATAETVTDSAMFAGEKPLASTLSLPAAATKTTPWAWAYCTASVMVWELPCAPQLALMTSAPWSAA